MKSFAGTLHCASRRHCAACRNDSYFRGKLETLFGPFACPLDLPIPCPAERLPEVNTDAKTDSAQGTVVRIERKTEEARDGGRNHPLSPASAFSPLSVPKGGLDKTTRRRIATSLDPCRFAHDTGEPWNPARPCLGHRIECGNPENKLDIVPARDCAKARCRFHAQMEMDGKQAVRPERERGEGGTQ